MRHFISKLLMILCLVFAFVLLAILPSHADLPPPTPAPATTFANPLISAGDAVLKTITGAGTSINATPTAPQAAPTSQKDIDQALGLLEDDAAREKLIRQLHALKAASNAVAGKQAVLDTAQSRQTTPATIVQDMAQSGTMGLRILESFSLHIKDISKQFVTLAESFSDLPQGTAWIERQIEDPVIQARWGLLAMEIVSVIGGALAAAFLVRQLLRRSRIAIAAHDPVSMTNLLLYLLARATLLAMPVAAFAFTAFTVLVATEPSRIIRLVTLSLVNASLLTQCIMLLAQIVLAPNAPKLRLLPANDETAAYGYVWLRRFAIIIIWAYFIILGGRTLGLPDGAADGLARICGLLVVMLAVIFVLQNRHPVRQLLAGSNDAKKQPGEKYGPSHDDRSPWRLLRLRFAEIWHVLAILYLVTGFFIGALSIEGGFTYLLRGTLLTLGAIVLIRVGLVLLHRTIARGFAIPEELKDQLPGLERRANNYLPILEQLLRFTIWVFAVLLVMDAWGLNGFALLTTPPGDRIASLFVSVVITLAIAVFFWEAVSGFIERYLRADSSGSRMRRNARARTLLPILRNTFLVVLIGITSLVVLSELGINATPLLAGAGVIGLAIGFGSQSLVQDFITGLFIVMEDAIAIGDVIQVKDHAGRVEAMTIRTIRLRDVNGGLHVMPYSEVKTLLNQSKGFGFAVVDMIVAYSADIDQALAAMKDEADKLREDETFAPFILEPLDILGVEAMSETGVTLRVRLKTLPDKQWTIRREMNKRFKIRFGIDKIAIPITSALTTQMPA